MTFENAFPAWLTETNPEPPYFWNINSYNLSLPELSISGWALPWYGLPNNKAIWLRNNTKLPFTDESPIDLSSHFPYWPNSQTSRLEAKAGDLSPEVVSDDAVTLMCAPSSQSEWQRPTLDQYSRWLSLPVSKSHEIPPAHLVAHIGESSPDFFCLSGKTLFDGFRLAAETFCGKPFHQLQSVLDWGCGPGRIGVHALNHLAHHDRRQIYHGVDIDHMTVEWAADKIGPHFFRSEINPPLRYEDGFFEFIFAYSVFTHLDLENQKRWLQELHRICSGNGVIAVTVMSELAMFFSQPAAKPDIIRAWKKAGISDSTKNDQLSESGISGNYYRNVWMTKDFIQSKWGQSFDILGLFPNFHFYQDLVVLRPKK